MLLDQFAFVLAVVSLAFFALRLGAWTIGPPSDAEPRSLWELILVAAPIAAGCAVAWTLLLGRFGLSGSTPLLLAGALALGVAGRFALAPSLVAGDVLHRLRNARRSEWVIGGLLLGLLVGFMWEIARTPGFGYDALNYHLPEAEGWVLSGHAGSLQYLDPLYPVAYYPVTGEVLISWLLGLSRSFAPLVAFSVTVITLALLGLWRLLELLDVPLRMRWLALGAVAALPMVMYTVGYFGPGTDMPPLAWLACSAALAPRCGRRPALLGPLVLALGLAVGTKTTVAPLGLAVLVWALWLIGPRWREVRAPLLLALPAALVVGAPWYLRDWITHGWPFWPLSTGPGADPLPRTLALTDVSFLRRPLATVRTAPREYLEFMGGGLALVVAAVLAPLLGRGRRTLIAACLALLAVLAWGLSPYTGLARTRLLLWLAPLQIRYLLSAMFACAVAVALAGRQAPASGRRALETLLGLAIVGSLVCDRLLGYPDVPRTTPLVAGVLIGGCVGAAFSGVPMRLRLRRPGATDGLGRTGQSRARAIRSIAASAAIVLAAFSLTVLGEHWLGREAKDGNAYETPLAYLLRQRSFRTGDAPVAMAPVLIATLAGPRLQHPLELIPASAPCSVVRGHRRRGWLVVESAPLQMDLRPYDALACMRGVRPAYEQGAFAIYSPRSS